MSEKHTSLPWHYQEDADDYTHIVRDLTGDRIVVSAGQDSSGKSEADCRLIVAAVNSYPSRQRLVSALEGCDEALQLAYKVPRPWIDGGVSYEEWEACCKKIDAAQAEARSALAEIGEKP